MKGLDECFQMKRRTFLAAGAAAMHAASSPLPAVRLHEPADGHETSLSIPHFRWEPMLEPKPEAMPSYVIQIATDKEFRRIVDEDRIAAVISWYVPDKELAPGEYWWRVAGVSAAGERGPWSPLRALRISRPQRTFPVRKGTSLKGIHRVFREAAANTPAQVVFEAGEYRLDPRELRVFADLKDVSDLTIDGNGSAIVLTSPGAFVHLTNCRRVMVKRFSFDYDPPVYTAGQIVAVDTKNGAIDADILPGHSLPDEFERYNRDRKGMIVTDTEDFAIKRGVQLVFPHAGFERVQGRRFRFRLENPKQALQLAPGDIYVLDPRWIDEGGGNTFFVAGGEDVVYFDLTVRGAANECLASFYADYHSILRLRLVRPEGRALSANNGGNNHHNARHGPWIEGCVFENTGDDICHVNGLVMGVMAQPARDRVQLALNQPFDQFGGAFLDIRPGDYLDFFDRPKGSLIARRRVVSVRRDNRSLDVTLDSPVEGLLVGRIAPSHTAQQAATQVFNASRGCNQFVFRRNTCRNGRRVGVLAKGWGGLVEDNTFTALGGGGVEFWNAPFEGLGAVDYVVTGNRILNCGRLSRQHAGIWATIFKSGNARLHRNLLIARNEISGFAGPSILLRDCENVVLGDNRIDDCTPSHEPIVQSNCANVAEKGNQVVRTGPCPAAPGSERR